MNPLFNYINFPVLGNSLRDSNAREINDYENTIVEAALFQLNKTYDKIDLIREESSPNRLVFKSDKIGKFTIKINKFCMNSVCALVEEALKNYSEENITKAQIYIHAAIYLVSQKNGTQIEVVSQIGNRFFLKIRQTGQKIGPIEPNLSKNQLKSLNALVQEMLLKVKRSILAIKNKNFIVSDITGDIFDISKLKNISLKIKNGHLIINGKTLEKILYSTTILRVEERENTLCFFDEHTLKNKFVFIIRLDDKKPVIEQETLTSEKINELKKTHFEGKVDITNKG